jgi:hypothetical protein
MRRLSKSIEYFLSTYTFACVVIYYARCRRSDENDADDDDCASENDLAPFLKLASFSDS